MKKKIGLFWLRDDFRITKNLGLYEATKNHDEVVAFYLYKESIYQNQEAQKWWLSKSLLHFKKQLSEFNINLEIIKIDSSLFSYQISSASKKAIHLAEDSFIPRFLDLPISP